MAFSWISVEGNIGSGKSTFGPPFSDFLSRTYLDENLESSTTFHKLLDEYNNDPRMSYQLQSWLTKKRTRDIISSKQIPIVTERSIFSDFVFSTANLIVGNMNNLQYKLYCDEFTRAVYKLKEVKKLPTQMLYLRAEPRVCLERIKKRGRTVESNVSLSYLETLHRVHENNLAKFSKKFGINFLTVDCSKDYADPAKVSTLIQGLH